MLEIREFKSEHGWLSNFWPVLIEHEGMTYRTTEHLFQALKTVDPEERRWVAAAETPAEAKRRGSAHGSQGRRLTLREGYGEDDRIRIANMQLALRLKFAFGSDLAERLLATGDANLVEGNHHHDNYWGDCCCGRLAKCARPGRNLLGKLLMERRLVLRLVPIR